MIFSFQNSPLPAWRVSDELEQNSASYLLDGGDTNLRRPGPAVNPQQRAAHYPAGPHGRDLRAAESRAAGQPAISGWPGGDLDRQSRWQDLASPYQRLQPPARRRWKDHSGRLHRVRLRL